MMDSRRAFLKQLALAAGIAATMLVPLPSHARAARAPGGLVWTASECGLVGCVAFCNGDALASAHALRAARFADALSCWGLAASAADAARVRARLLLHYPERDAGSTQVADFESALRSAGVTYMLHAYPDTGPPFPALARRRTQALFSETLVR